MPRGEAGGSARYRMPYNEPPGRGCSHDRPASAHARGSLACGIPLHGDASRAPTANDIARGELAKNGQRAGAGQALRCEKPHRVAAKRRMRWQAASTATKGDRDLALSRLARRDNGRGRIARDRNGRRNIGRGKVGRGCASNAETHDRAHLPHHVVTPTLGV